MVAKIAHFALPPGDPFDLFDIVDLKTGMSTIIPLDQQGYQNGPLAVCVNTTSGSLIKSRQE